jgi:hypothetical protein
MQTDNFKINEQNICIIAATLEKTNIELDEPDSDSDEPDSDSDEQTLLNESFMRTQCSEDNESESELDTNINININTNTIYTCTMCSLVLKINTSFCNASCEQKYVNHKE